MSSVEWIYEYKFKTRWFALAKIKTQFKHIQKQHNNYTYILEYKKSNGYWTQVGFL